MSADRSSLGRRVRRPIGRAAFVAGLALLVVTSSASPAAAHVVGGPGDLPVPTWLLVYGAVGALVVAFAALGVVWPKSRFDDRRRSSRPLPELVQRGARLLVIPARVLGLAAFGLVLASAAFGTNDAAFNLAPSAVWIVFWAGLQAASALLGDVWRVVSPFDTLAAAGAWIRRRARGEVGPGRAPPAWGHWPAAVLLLGFVWMELVYVEPSSPRAIAAAMVVYTVVMLAGAARWGRGWLRQGDAFAVWFGLLSAMAPLHRDGSGRLAVRPPLSGLAGIQPLSGTVVLPVVVLGATIVDALVTTELWRDILGSRVGWDAVPFATLGLLWTIGAVAVVAFGAVRATAWLIRREPETLARWFAHGLVPIAFAYVVAHYFSVLVLDGQAALIHVSDPLGLGWDLFGTAGWSIDLTLLSTGAITWVQVAGIVLGHVGAVLVVHDRAIARLPNAVAVRSEYPLLGSMLLSSGVGVALLLGGPA